MINGIWRLFETEKEKKEKKEEANWKIIKDNMIRDTRILFEQEK